MLSEPSPWVARFAPLIPAGGAVLDLACGGGRHSRLLAALGYEVEAVDRNAEALAGLAGMAGIHTHCADLEGGPWPYGGRAFAGIVVTNYLWRPLFPFLLSALDQGGLLIYETFMVGNEVFRQPSNPAFLLRPGELLEVVRGRLSVLAFEQGQVGAAVKAAVGGRRPGLPEEVGSPEELMNGVTPAVVQRLCAQRGGSLYLPD